MMNNNRVVPPLVLPCPAKLNLYLHITGKREDGYHLLDGMVGFVELGDRLTIAPCDDAEITLKVSGPFALGVPEGERNLVYQAARALQQEAGITNGAALALEKRLPMASGIGGGSSDAASALRGLAALWGVEDEALLMRIAASLGADVPMCLKQASCYIAGIGDELTPCEALPEMGVVLVNPLVEVSSVDVYRRGVIDHSGSVMDKPGHFPSLESLLGFLKKTQNDLTQTACGIAPEVLAVLHVLEQQEHCRFARMSGSGATCFGLFETAVKATEAAKALQEGQSGWWVRSTVFQRHSVA